VLWDEAIAANCAAIEPDRDHRPWVDRERQVLEFLSRDRRPRRA
jgi:hypothetical protein